MSEVSERYSRVAADFTSRIQGVPPEGWSAATPCTEWSVRALLEHVVGAHHMAISGLTGTGTAPTTTADVVAAWRTASAEVAGALDDPARSSAVISAGPLGEQPFEQVVSTLICADTLLHTWDLARATGQDERLDPTAVHQSMEFLTPLDEGMRGPGRFAAKIDPPPDADEQTRLLNFCGRGC